MRCCFFCAFFLLIALTPISSATDQELPPLPSPLTLDDALAFADAAHPALDLASARLAQAASGVLDASATNGTRVSALGRLGVVDPSDRAIDRHNRDHRARLLVSKRLYDFGYSASVADAAELRLRSMESEYLDARQQRRLSIMRTFFDVLLADLAYARDNEAMATAFVAIDKARDRRELGQVSDIDVLALEADYQRARRERFASAALQRATRARLAAALNRPTDLPPDLIMPAEPDMSQPLPEVEELVIEVFANNPSLKAMQLQVDAGTRAIAAAEKAEGPVLRGEADASWWDRVTGSTHPLSAGLILEVPLYTGGAREAKLAIARAKLHEARARLAQTRLDLRQTVLDLWLELDTLRIRMEEVDVLGDYRELYLDRSRALYELEVRTDLGDAMVQTSAVSLQRAQVVFDWLMAQARVAALAARLVENTAAGESRAESAP